MKWLLTLALGAVGATLLGLYFTGAKPPPEKVVATATGAQPALAPARIPASTPAIGAKSIAGLKREISDVKACYETEQCDFPNTDPRSYSVAVGRKLAALLRDLRTQHPDDPDLEALARDYMEVDDGFVQEEAMKIFSSLPPSRENVVAMISGLENAHDPLLVEQAMQEWERYVGSPEEAAIQEFLANFIARGGQFSSEKASEQILSFLNERSVATFQAALASMDPDTTPARNLRAALHEYSRQQSGG